MRKWKILLFVLILCITISYIILQARSIPDHVTPRIPSYDATFALNQKEDERTVTQDIGLSDLPNLGFELITSSGDLQLYLNRSILNIAIYDERNDYLWFGYYPGYQDKPYTSTLKRWIESGVTIDYYDATTLNEARMSVTHPDAGTTINYQLQNNGFIAKINMVKLGISFDLHVTLDNDELNVELPYTSIVEVPYQTAAMKFPKEYKVQSVIVFPYLGSQNYEINGYAMIPDGSGALIRYTDTPYDSAYVKRIYGRDYGIQSDVTTQDHLKDETLLSLPVYGINHGYQQAAFLAEMTSGYGAAELHSYPYMYNSIDINTTFFLYKTRDRSLIKLSGGAISTIPLINKDPYPFDYAVKYSFLSDEDANYSGMANRYKEHLNLENEDQDDMDMHLELVGIDSKPSLFGETKVKLTTYREAKKIISDLYQDIDHLMVTYRSWQKGGTYGRSPYAFAYSDALGGRRAFNQLVDQVHALDGVTLSLENSPLTLAKTKVFDSELRKTTLDLFEVAIDSSRDPLGTMLSVTGISERIKKGEKRYNSYELTDLSIKAIGDLSFSYQKNQQTIYREQMIAEMKQEMEELDHYHLGLYEPANYFYPYMSRYYEMPYQSNAYAYISESIPFIPLVLSGASKLYSPLLNYINHLDDMILKMIEYNLRPSFIVTYQPGYFLRYTHVEYLYTTAYDVWKDDIIYTYEKVSEILSDVQGESMLRHRYIMDGVVEITYQSKIIYVNYTEENQTIGDHTVSAHSAISVEVNP